MRIAIGSSSATVQAASCSDRLKAVQSIASLLDQDVGTEKPLASRTSRPCGPRTKSANALASAEASLMTAMP